MGTPAALFSRLFYVHNGRRYGPVDLYGLVDLIIKQELPEDVLVWHPGLTEWTRANALEEVRQQMPPPVPLPAHELAMGAPGPALETGDFEAIAETMERSLGQRDWDRREHPRRRHHPVKPAETGPRWLTVVLVVLLGLMVGLWWLLKRFNEVPGGRVILHESRLADPSPPRDLRATRGATLSPDRRLPRASGPPAAEAGDDRTGARSRTRAARPSPARRR
jgi:hypothetical protein